MKVYKVRKDAESDTCYLFRFKNSSGQEVVRWAFYVEGQINYFTDYVRQVFDRAGVPAPADFFRKMLGVKYMTVEELLDKPWNISSRPYLVNMLRRGR